MSQSSSGVDRRLGNAQVSSQRSHGTPGSKSPARRPTHRATLTRSQAGDLDGKYGVQASASDLEALPLGPNPPPGDSALGYAIRYSPPRSESKRPVERPSSSDTGHSARLATKRSVQQSQVNRPVYSEHVPFTPGPGKPDTGQMTGTRCPVSPTTPGKPGAPTTPGSPGRFSSHRSTDQCTLNMYRSHQDPVKPGTGQMTGTRCSVSPTTPGKLGAPTTPGSLIAPVTPGSPVTPDALVRPVYTGQKAQKEKADQCLDQSELPVLNSPVRLVQLEHNVHEPLGNMPTLQIEHSSEHSQAFQDLRNSDIPVPGNIGYTGSDQAQPVTPGALVTPGDPSLGTLFQIDPLGLGPIPPIPTLGIWLVSLGFRHRPLT